MTALRGVAAGMLGLIALQAVGQAGSAGRIGSLMGLLDQLVTRAIDPKVPLIPDRRDPGSSTPLTDPSVAVAQAGAAAAGAGAALTGHGAVATAAKSAGLVSTKFQPAS